MKTQKQILARIKLRKPEDFFGFEISDYIFALTLDNANKYYEKPWKEENWEDESEKPREHWVAKIKDYMPFAQGKADDKRGLSANRNISHFIAWAWLAGDDEFSDKISEMHENDYAPYGQPILKEVSEFYER